MADLDDVERRLSGIEDLLGLGHAPPLDRLSGIEFRIDSLRSLVERNGLSITEVAGLVTRLEARQVEMGRDVGALKSGQAELLAGQQAIIALLRTLEG